MLWAIFKEQPSFIKTYSLYTWSSHIPEGPSAYAVALASLPVSLSQRCCWSSCSCHRSLSLDQVLAAFHSAASPCTPTPVSVEWPHLETVQAPFESVIAPLDELSGRWTKVKWRCCCSEHLAIIIHLLPSSMQWKGNCYGKLQCNIDTLTYIYI